MLLFCISASLSWKRSTSAIVCCHNKQKWIFLYLRLPPRKDSILVLPLSHYRETPLALPRVLRRSFARSFVRWRHNQIFSAWWVTKFAKEWGPLGPLGLRYYFLRGLERVPLRYFYQYCTVGTSHFWFSGETTFNIHKEVLELFVEKKFSICAIAEM